jgi:hypothetical protein
MTDLFSQSIAAFAFFEKLWIGFRMPFVFKAMLRFWSSFVRESKVLCFSFHFPNGWRCNATNSLEKCSIVYFPFLHGEKKHKPSKACIERGLFFSIENKIKGNMRCQDSVFFINSTGLYKDLKFSDLMFE